MSDEMHCPRCGSADVECQEKPHVHLCHACGYDGTTVSVPMRVVSLHQPWATGMAEGWKTAETRSWGTPYRGDLAIASTANAKEWLRIWDQGHRQSWGAEAKLLLDIERRLTEDVDPLDDVPHEQLFQLGAILCVVRVVTVARVVPLADFDPTDGTRDVVLSGPAGTNWRLELWSFRQGQWRHQGDLAEQMLWGDYSPGRSIWITDNRRKLTTPVPYKGRQGCTDLRPDVKAQVLRQLDAHPAPAAH